MTSSLPCSAAELLPHRGNMLLLRSLDQWEEQRAVASACMDDARLFCDSLGRTESAALIEMAAQTVFAWTGWRDRSRSAPPVTGYLAGLRQFRFLSSPLPGEPLRVRCQEVLRISGSAVVETEVHGKAGLLAAGRLLLVETEEVNPADEPARALSRTEPSLTLPEWLLAYSGTRSPLAQSLLLALTHYSPMDGDGTLVRFAFRAGFPAFDGHFPGRPLLPGVALLEAACLACELTAARPLQLAEVVRAKFIWPVAPESALAFIVHPEEGFLRARVAISLDEQPVADIALRFRESACERQPS